MMSSSEPYQLKVGDLEPKIRIQLLDDGEPVNLTGATACRFVMRLPGAGSPKVNAAAAFESPRTSGVVAYTWQTADTDTVGTYRAEVEVDWTTGRTQTFPPGDYLIVQVVDDLA